MMLQSTNSSSSDAASSLSSSHHQDYQEQQVVGGVVGAASSGMTMSMTTEKWSGSNNLSEIEIGNPNPDSYYPWILTAPSLIFLSACICANGTIFIFVLVSKTYRSPANYLLANLCLASTIYIANMIVFTVEKENELWSYGPYVCIATSVAHRFPLPLMTLTIMTLSLDRSRIARNPLSHPSKSSVVLQILIVWLVSAALMVPRAIISSFDPNTTGAYKCVKVLLWNSWVAHALYAFLNSVAIFILPASVLILEWRKTRSQMKYLSHCQIEQGKSFGRRLRLMRNACIFTCIFLTCWLPLGLIQFPLDMFPTDFPVPTSLKTLVTLRDFFRGLVLIQVCLNPITLYCLSFDLKEFLTSCIA